MYSAAPWLLAAWTLTYLPHVVAAAYRFRMEGGYDNQHPRAQEAKLTGVGARAVAAHQNSFEAFPPFAAGAILCQVQGVDGTVFSAVFVSARLLYIGFYLGGLGTLRSTAWAIGVAATVAMFVTAWLRTGS